MVPHPSSNNADLLSFDMANPEMVIWLLLLLLLFHFLWKGMYTLKTNFFSILSMLLLSTKQRLRKIISDCVIHK